LPALYPSLQRPLPISPRSDEAVFDAAMARTALMRINGPSPIRQRGGSRVALNGRQTSPGTLSMRRDTKRTIAGG
ncbi:MAG: hypothetical protein AAGJ87_06415, partial [Pseudomonadota bacterium]